MPNEQQELHTRLAEAATLGNWLESRIHLAFTELADNMFGEGRLTREERIGLSSAIGEALTAFNAAIAASVPGVYERSPWADPDEAAMSESDADAAPEADDTDTPAAPLQERAIEGEYVPLVERAVRGDGTMFAKLIKPGWGSSGYYPAEVLERDGPQVFRAGLKSYWNHPTHQEEIERPEGDLNALAAELVTDARYLPNGPDGPGLYADAKVFGPYREAVNELARHIGVSIRASGRAVQGEADGRRGPIVQELTAARSVDFVTQPGAGGRILEMFEAARPQAARPQTQTQEESVNEQEFREALAAVQQENARLREAMLLRDARDFVREAVATATVPDVTKRRLVASLSGNPPVTDDGQLDTETYRTRISEAVTAEVEYLTQAAGYGSGRIEGMGSGGSAAALPEAQESAQQRMAEAFRALGLSEQSAAYAAKGRAY